jgi:hypothetical protein
MSIQFKSFTFAAALAAPLFLSACDGSVRRQGVPETKLQVVRADAERNRLWVLEPEALSLYDNTNGRRLRRLALPLPFFVGEEHACAPDIAWDSAGTVFVSSNVLPVLWRVDPQRFEVTRIEIELGADGDKDVGFTGLSFAADDVLIAAGTTYASLWRIDLRTGGASKVASYPLTTRACDPAALVRAGRGQLGPAIAALPVAARY